ncbi:MAG: serine esterase [Pelagibacteraceae bacterium TMED216]|nr:MAG: serine esterase [Pelagibacteraceae bacterium TMED216]|tara:strand:- start:2974 stop:3627 length:654 start_codon:yes stop_codon:yes gene_type:complete
MSYSLNTTVIKPISDQKPKNAVILCHGYGGDGKDISILANYWKNFLPDTIFICPDAPEVCAVNPAGFQWFDLTSDSSDQILTQSIVAELKLNKFIDEIKENYNFDASKISLCGFSQGSMISLQTAIKRKDMINSIISYSGKIIDTEHLSKNIISRPKILLMHGDRDEVVTINSFLEAKEFFKNNKYDIQSKIFNNCEHRIPQEGSSLGLNFVKKNLY